MQVDLTTTFCQMSLGSATTTLPILNVINYMVCTCTYFIYLKYGLGYLILCDYLHRKAQRKTFFSLLIIKVVYSCSFCEL